MSSIQPHSNVEGISEIHSKMRYNRGDRNSINRFSALVEDDEDEDDGANGGVMLRNFKEDSPSSYAGTSTPIGTHSISTQSVSSQSSSSSGHDGTTEMGKKPFITTYNSQAGTSGRRNSIAPIGTGRFNANVNSPTPSTSRASGADTLTEAWVRAEDPSFHSKSLSFNGKIQKQAKATGFETDNYDDLAAQSKEFAAAATRDLANMMVRFYRDYTNHAQHGR